MKVKKPEPKHYKIALMTRGEDNRWRPIRIDNYKLRHTVWKDQKKAEAKCAELNAADGLTDSQWVQQKDRYMVIAIY